MSYKPSMKQINTWKEQLQQIIQMQKKEGELVPAKQKEELQKLAQEVGASTRGIGYHDEGKPFGYDASIAELIDNIHKALQTLTFIKNCEYARRSVCVALVAIIVSIVGVFAALKANKLAFVSLQNSYTPWLQITSIEPLALEPNEVEIKYVCKNFSNGGPALNLDIEIMVFGKSTTRKLYKSNVLMPNDQSSFSSYVDLHGTYQPKNIVEKLKDGESPVVFDIYFNDIFGRKIKIHQEYKSTKGIFRMTEYKVN